MSDVTRVEIPGTVTAHYQDGFIIHLVFVPSASAAGYFGPSAELVDGDEDLDLEDVEGPFWKAMQRRVSDGAAGSEFAAVIGWEE